jgi:hypothetical protein
MPSDRASTAALAASATDRRATPGMEGIGSRASAPSWMTTDQIRSAGDRVVSRTSRRVQSAWRRRRSRRAGRRPPAYHAAGADRSRPPGRQPNRWGDEADAGGGGQRAPGERQVAAGALETLAMPPTAPQKPP